MELREKIPVRSDKTASRLIDKEAVIVLLDKQETVVLNEVASRIWEIIDGQKNIDELARAITAEFDVAYEKAVEDVAGFLEDMAQRGAITLNKDGKN